jgi:hypothetical protein
MLFIFVFLFCIKYSGNRASTLNSRIADCQAHRSWGEGVQVRTPNLLASQLTKSYPLATGVKWSF